MPSLPLAHSVLGDGPPVLVLHGLLGQSRNWQGIARSLAERYRVFMVDLRNHGASPHDDEMTYPAMAGDVARLIEEAGLERPAVIGHSMGGNVCSLYAGVRPGRFRWLSRWRASACRACRRTWRRPGTPSGSTNSARA